MRRPVTLIKIPLEEFIDILIGLYDMGADFVDIVGIPNENQDFMSVNVKLAYISKERDQFEGEGIVHNNKTNNTNQPPHPLSDEDINSLTQ